MTYRLRFWVLLLAFGCGAVTAAPPDASSDGAAGAGAAGAGAAGTGTGGAAGAAGTGASGTGGAPCTPAVVQLTAGAYRCDCGGTCAPCPVASGPSCGGSGLGHPNWTACEVGGAPYAGCAAAPDGGALGACCPNDCSTALCGLTTQAPAP